ncbi:P-loop containing nucleoside triphosphate hydrolase protein [Martensiomyces pterosporus]|nr:P-loop containing nucleoside triphosphate hydrolase protein [Martensiomyces pterosporus]
MWTVADKRSNANTAAAAQQRTNKRRKGGKKQAGAKNSSGAHKTSEQEWADISMNPPPMPTSNRPASLDKPSNNGKRSKPGSAATAKAPKKAKHEDGQKATGADLDIEDVAEWEWKDVTAPTYLGGADNEIGGMVSLQEIDGVDCSWEEDKATGGRILKFRNTKSGAAGKKSKSGKSQQKPRALTDIPVGSDDEDDGDDFYETVDWDDFVLMDDFSEERAGKGELKSIGEQIRDAQNNELKSLSDDDSSDSGTDNDGNDEDVQGGDGSDDDAKEEEEPPAKEPKDESEDEEDPGEDNRAEEDVEDPDVDVSAWENYGVHPLILRALKHRGFSVPTEIQSKTLTKALSGRDIIGAAETGSGKTLAFGIPMLQHIAKHRGKWTGPTGLILTPTRELAIQVKDHVKAMARFVRARVVAIVGGMSQAKQERLLTTSPDIIVATPGRFWDLVSSNDTYLNYIRSISFLAIDEADRMLEPGHFMELKYIFKAINEAALKPQQKRSKPRQTFVFSATLLKDMQFNARRVSEKAKKMNKGKPKPGSMEDLIERVNFQDKSPAFVDVTQPDATARTLVEARIDCLANEKDFYLYYFLVRYPARTLVFVNSIDSIRRMVPILRLLNVNVFGLHAQMEQRQRLKNVDRFRDTENAVLVASDVAARGLDIPKVEYVIHYQLPRSGDLYVHRSGRTARARHEGLAIMLVSPEERKSYYKMCAVLNKDLTLFPVDLDLLGRLKSRVDLARQIDLKEHKLNKLTHERNWFKKNAEELDIELDSDFMPSSDDEEGSELARSNKQGRLEIKSLKNRLKSMLSKKIMTRGISGRYLSSGVISDLAERLTDQASANPVIPTLRKESALDAAKSKLQAQKKR